VAGLQTLGLLDTDKQVGGYDAESCLRRCLMTFASLMNGLWSQAVYSLNG